MNISPIVLHCTATHYYTGLYYPDEKKSQCLFELDIFPPALLTTQQKGKKVRNEGRIIIVRSGENSHNFN